jgi:hypothetical protein
MRIKMNADVNYREELISVVSEEILIIIKSSLLCKHPQKEALKH